MAGAAVAGLLAGCGGSGQAHVANVATVTTNTASTTTAGSRPKTFVAFAECMTSHGVPTKAGARGGMIISGGPSPSTLQAAQKACKALLPAGQTTNPPITQAQRHAMLAFAACMRSHGVPDYADPSFPPGGGIFGGGLPVGEKNSPAVTRAAAVCNKLPGPESAGR